MQNYHRMFTLIVILLSCLVPLIAAAGTFSFTGNTLPNGPFWDRTNTNCSSSTSSLANQVAYQFQNFTVDASGDYQFESTQEYDGYLHLLLGSFDPATIQTSCISSNDDGTTGVGSSLIQSASLDAGTEYTLVSSAYADGQFGVFENTISGPGAVTFGTSGGDPLVFDPENRQALETLFEATNGASWGRSSGWLGSTGNRVYLVRPGVRRRGWEWPVSSISISTPIILTAPCRMYLRQCRLWNCLD